MTATEEITLRADADAAKRFRDATIELKCSRSARELNLSADPSAS